MTMGKPEDLGRSYRFLLRLAPFGLTRMGKTRMARFLLGTGAGGVQRSIQRRRRKLWETDCPFHRFNIGCIDSPGVAWTIFLGRPRGEFAGTI